MVELIEKYKNSEEEVLNQVNHKLLIRVGVLKPTLIEDMKVLIRGLFAEAGIPIRNRVDISEEVFVGSDTVHGEVIVAVRVDRVVNNVEEQLSDKLNELGLSDLFEIRGNQVFDIMQLREIHRVFNRALYKVVLNLGDKGDEGYYKVKGDWKKNVVRFDGSIDEVATVGDIFISSIAVDGAEGVYEVLVDVPHGVDVIRVIEKHFKLRKGSFEKYPVEIIHVYEEVGAKFKSMTRKRCAITDSVIERTVGGLIGDVSIKGIMDRKPRK